MEKKIQGNIKSAVKSFGELVQCWCDERKSCQQHLNYLQSLIQTKFSIFQTLKSGSKWSSLMVTANHPDLLEKFNVILIADMENTLMALRESSRDLESLAIAMKLRADEVWQLLAEQPIDSFGDEAVFDTSHVLEIVDLTNDFFGESERFKSAVNVYFSESLDISMTAMAIDKTCNQIKAIFGDNEGTFLSQGNFLKRAEVFLLQNGIETAFR